MEIIETIEILFLGIITQVYGAIGWPGVVFLMAIESAAIPFPSELIMPLAGWLLIQAKGGSVWWVLLAGFYGGMGNLLGSWVAYWISMKGGRPLLLKYGKYVLMSKDEVDKAEIWFNKYGEWAVFIGRLLPVVRTFISIPAGLARKTKLMQRVERDHQRPLERLLPEMVNEVGLSATAEELGVSKATLGYWLLKLGINVRRVALAPGETLEVKRAS